MTQDTGQKIGFEPIHAAHAIEQVAFVVQFDKELNEVALTRLRAISEEFKEDLPGITEMQSIGFAFGAPMASISHNQVAGLVRRNVCRDGSIECELRIERASITFITNRYTRWASAWKQANKYLERLLPVYLETASLVAVGLNYIDKFAWEGDVTKFDASLLLQSGSKYIANHILDTKEFWHSHTGVFIRVDDFTKRLLNLNLDYLDDVRPEGLKRVVVITTTVTDQFYQPGYSPLDYQAKGPNFVHDHMQSMHVFSKKIFGELITPEMGKRIALNAE